MTDSKFAIAILKTTLSALLILGVGLWSRDRDTLAQISTPEDTVHYLKGIAAEDNKCPDSINSKSANPCSESMINLPSQRATELSLSAYSNFKRLTDHPRSNWEVKAASQAWNDLNRGDGSRDLIRLIVWRF